MIATARQPGLHSAIYEGWVRHRRFTPRGHAFIFPLYMVYLDLDEVDEVFSLSRLWSATRAAPVRFRASDYLGGGEAPLAEAVRAKVADATGARPAGAIRMLTHLRHFGYVFNPVTFYYCFDKSDSGVETIVAEITNTPWKERRAYVLSRRREGGGPLRFRFEKVFHVSPFMPMDVEYDWGFSEPASHLGVHMTLRRAGGRVFDATLRMTRRELSPAQIRRTILRRPLMTGAVITRIHLEALRLWLKRVPVQPHPRRGEGAAKGAAR